MNLSFPITLRSARPARSRRGMSIIELLVVIAIIILLAALILGAAMAVKKIVRSLSEQATNVRR